ncbi:spoT ppGpp hydrolase [Orientia tsutsugamushi]|uniref:SpoT ppGpp hydrolase n=2 Tax=Orientia tsutsugamushi TaxID=784 RepID=A0A2U3QYD5_ORITS|nr:hypothetical protein OTSUT76_1471 [Orientia tsutsugamushi str. UT76]SPR05956.1 spoT ppGpp hydrolase [Orientia tsutsugamushi]
MFIYQKSRLNMLKPTFGIQWNNVVVGLLIIIITACVFSFEPALADTLEGQLNKIDGLYRRTFQWKTKNNRYSNNVGNRYNQINFIKCATAMRISLN